MIPPDLVVALLLPLIALPDQASLVLMPLKSDSIKAGPLAALNELLAVGISQQSRFRVVTRDDLEAELGRSNMQQALGCDAIACAAEIGGALGARYLLAGSARRLGGNLIITVSLIDTESREARRGKAIIEDQEDLYPGAIDMALREVLEGRMSSASPAASPVSAPTAPASPAPGLSAALAPSHPGAGASPPALALASEPDFRLASLREDLVTKLWPARIDDRQAHARVVAYQRSPAAKEDSKSLRAILAEQARRTTTYANAWEASEGLKERLKECRASPPSASACIAAGDLVISDPTIGGADEPGDLYSDACRAGSDDGCARGRALAASLRFESGPDAGRLIADLCLGGDAESCKAVEDGNAVGWAEKFRGACTRIAEGKAPGPRDDYACYLLVAKKQNTFPSVTQKIVALLQCSWVTAARG